MSGRVLLSGFYGMGNAGDEAVLAAIVAGIRRHAPDLEPAVLSGDPPGTAAAYGVEAFGRMRAGEALGAIRRCDVFVSGGGSLLQDRTSLKSLLYYLTLLKLARLAGRRTMIYAQGIGPLVRPAARRLTARVLSGVDAITVRDADSATLLGEIGVSTRRCGEIEVTADPVFSLDAEVSPLVQSYREDRPFVGVSLRPWPGMERILDPLAQSLDALGSEMPIQAWGLHPDDDLQVCDQLARRVPRIRVVRETLRPAEWVGLAGLAAVVIGMRLHSLIFAASQAVPALGISYDPKVDALMKRIRGPVVGSADRLDATLLEQALSSALATGPEGRRERELRACHLRDRALRNVERLRELATR